MVDLCVVVKWSGIQVVVWIQKRPVGGQKHQVFKWSTKSYEPFECSAPKCPVFKWSAKSCKPYEYSTPKVFIWIWYFDGYCNCKSGNTCTTFGHFFGPVLKIYGVLYYSSPCGKHTKLNRRLILCQHFGQLTSTLIFPPCLIFQAQHIYKQNPSVINVNLIIFILQKNKRIAGIN